MDTFDLSLRELDLITRAGAHSLAETRLAPVQRFRDGVTDLDVARLIHRIERGTTIVPSSPGCWTVLAGPNALIPHLSRVVREAMRVGLVHEDTVRTAPDVVRTILVAAPVHLRHPRLVRGQTACTASARVPYGRFRTLPDVDLVDCSACLMAHR